MRAARSFAAQPAPGSSLWGCMLLLVAGLFFSALIPPFQSPDEFDHIKRAFFLSQGQIVLTAPPGQSSGGEIDTGLAEYFYAYTVLPFKPERKLSRDEMLAAQDIRWSGVKVFSPAPGTGYYFPLIYLPQAIGLAAGKMIGLTVEHSYYLARLLALMTVAGVLFVAFSNVPPSPLTWALLFIPMSLFQVASASLDGVSTALAILALAGFLRLADKDLPSPPGLFWAMLICVVLVTSSRVHLMPLWVLVFVAGLRSKDRRYLAAAALGMSLVMAWLVIAIRTNVDVRPSLGATPSAIGLFYLKQPMQFFSVLKATLTNPEMLLAYRDSFLGVLGWLDTRFSERTYFNLSMSLGAIAVLSLSLRDTKDQWISRIWLLAGAGASVLLVYFALLVTWNPHPAPVIHGVQGRYFLVPALMLSYALTGTRRMSWRLPRSLAMALLFLLIGFALFSTPRLLIDRYYRAPVQPAAMSFKLPQGSIAAGFTRVRVAVA
jgi:uncharacterized membrane protein